MHSASIGQNERRAERRASRAIDLSPMAIARHPALTVREKLDMLDDIKLQLDSDMASTAALGFGIAEVDAAISELRQRAYTGRTPATPMPREQH
jgi:hypothetical protein